MRNAPSFLVVAIVSIATPVGALSACGRARVDEAHVATSTAKLVTAASAMLTARRDHAATLLADGRVMVVGGQTSDGDAGHMATPTCEIYAPATGQWTATGVLEYARSHHRLARLSTGAVVAFGGDDSASAPHTEVWTAAKGTWSAGGTMGASRASAASFVRSDDRIVAIGGQTSDGGGSPLASTEIYDSTAGSWSAGPTMSVARALAVAMPLDDDRFVVAGGYDGTQYRADGELCTISTSSCALITGPNATMSDTRSRFTATRLDDGRWLLVGGFGSGIGYGYAPTTSLFDPIAMTFTDGPTLSVAREEHTATLLGDGRVLVAGGELALPDDAGVATPAPLELLDVVHGTTILATPLPDVRYTATASPLADGSVLIAGGGPDDWGTGYRSVASVSLFSLGGAGSVCGGPGDCASGLCGAGGTCVAAADGGVTDAASNMDASFEASAADASNMEASFEASADAASNIDTSFEASADAASNMEASFEASAADASDMDATVDAHVDAAMTPDARELGDVATPTPTNNPSVQGNATSCSTDAECATQHCVDHVCCDTACVGACVSCALAESPGVCALVPFGVDPRGDCTGDGTCVSTCGGAGACVPATGATVCAVAQCTDASHGVGVAICSGNRGTCDTAAEAPFDCREFACLPAFGACASTCADSTECAPGFTCDGAGHCVAAASPTASGCSCSVQPRDTADGAIELGVALGVASIVVARRRRRSAR